MPSIIRKFIGFLLASTYSLAYLIVPFYSLFCVYLLSSRLYERLYKWDMEPGKIPLVYYLLMPILLSAAIPPIGSYWLITSSLYSCMRDYFDYTHIFEIEDKDLIAYKKPVILAGMPHGVISFGGLCAGTHMVPEYRNLKTGVASVVLKVPIVKHLLGVFNLIDVGAESLNRHVRDTRKSNLDRSIVIYIGGIAELFKCSNDVETLVSRKGFIKVALREGLDIVPIYFFGNTSVLSIPKNKTFERISRKMQMSLTYFYGLFGLPLPRPNKLLYVRGKPIELPHLTEAQLKAADIYLDGKVVGNTEVDKFFEEFKTQVTRIFDTYKSQVPGYENKSLEFELVEDLGKKTK